jgi:hypothetical protein
VRSNIRELGKIVTIPTLDLQLLGLGEECLIMMGGGVGAGFDTPCYPNIQCILYTVYTLQGGSLIRITGGGEAVLGTPVGSGPIWVRFGPILVRFGPILIGSKPIWSDLDPDFEIEIGEFF